MSIYGERYGLWWLPSFPEKKVKGRLSWSREQGGRLQLQTAFSDPAISELERVPIRPYTTEIILGDLEAGQQCTLAKNTANMLGDKPRFHSLYLLEGARFHNILDLRASGASFRMRHLEEWTGQTPLNHDEEALKNPFQIRLKQVTSPFKPLHLVDSDISKPGRAKMSVAVTYNPAFGFRRFMFEQICRILVEVNEEPFAFDELLMLIRDCSNLFTLLMAEEAGVFDIWFWLKDRDAPTRKVRLLYPGLRGPAKSEIHPSDMLLSLPGLKDASMVLSNWMNQGPTLRRTANWLTLNTRIKGWPEIEFLSYVQAAETLHRVLKPPGKFVSDSDYSRVEVALISAIPLGTNNDLKQKIRQMLVYGNEVSLRRRLRELMKIFFPTIPDSHKKWIERIVDTRNYFIHNDPESAPKAASGQELFNLCDGLRGLVTAALLHSVGVPSNTVLAATANHGWIIR
jgi:hypothetical protein